MTSTKPVEVYTLQGIPNAGNRTNTDKQKSDVPQATSGKWSHFFQTVGTLALLGLAGGTLAGILTGASAKTDSIWTETRAGAVAGLLSGILLGGGVYIWEYSFGYEILNNIYSLPEKAIDFNRE